MKRCIPCSGIRATVGGSASTRRVTGTVGTNGTVHSHWLKEQRHLIFVSHRFNLVDHRFVLAFVFNSPHNFDNLKPDITDHVDRVVELFSAPLTGRMWARQLGSSIGWRQSFPVYSLRSVVTISFLVVDVYDSIIRCACRLYSIF